MLGLVFDLGHIYVVKNELQAYVDAAAVAAAYELDGSQAGITAAATVASTGPTTGGASPNRYDFSTATVANVAPTFAPIAGGPYQASGTAPATSRFVQVSATAPVSLYFLPILNGIATSSPVAAVAIAGQGSEDSLGEGLAPFSPDAHNAADPNFGFTPGQDYTLKWPPPGQRTKPGNTCSGDVGFTPANGSSERGYIDVGQGNGNSALTDTIVNNQFYLDQPYIVGTRIDWVPGNKHVGPAADTRYAQDTDTSSATYSTYNGNGRRTMIVPVNNNDEPAIVVGFGLFLMPPGFCGPKNTSPCCGEYVGPAVVGSSQKGAGASGGLYRVKLFE
jgi:hypothetical protein